MDQQLSPEELAQLRRYAARLVAGDLLWPDMQAYGATRRGWRLATVAAGLWLALYQQRCIWRWN
jgi:hypothetical protein